MLVVKVAIPKAMPCMFGNVLFVLFVVVYRRRGSFENKYRVFFIGQRAKLGGRLCMETGFCILRVGRLPSINGRILWNFILGCLFP